MCHNILGDVARFCFLYFIVYLPYTCSFWMMFGGDVEEFETVSETLFSLFRMTLVDEYNYDGLKEENPVMCDILVGTYLAISAIVLLNLFIAMLSETFVRIHDNASSNALMERAAIILSLEDNLSDEKKLAYYKHVQTKCAPMVEYYDDDMALEGKDNDVRKVTFQIKDQMAALVDTINKKGLNSGEEQKYEQQLHEIHRINHELNSLKAQNEKAMASIHEILDILRGPGRFRSTKSVHVRAGRGTFHQRRGINE
ncbi:polycystin-2-like protein 2 [Ptychodera flava]|uniref:polycystin-2-like protein 2 n=1 Tax=Ptychodera flava TaxID=63121 RepID=UPI00396A0131